MTQTKETSIEIIKIEKNNCPSCVTIKPMLDKLMKEFSLDYSIINVSTDLEIDANIITGVRSAPSLVIRKNGQTVSIIAGTDEDTIRNAINSALNT